MPRPARRPAYRRHAHPRRRWPVGLRLAGLVSLAAVGVAFGGPSGGGSGEPAALVSQPGVPVAAAARQRPTSSPTEAPAAPLATVDPGPDDRRSVRDAPRPAPLASLTGYVWPVPRGRLTLPFGPTRWGSRIVDGERFHDGIDLATFCGDRIVAAHDGRVLAAGRRFDHVMGWRGDLGPYHERLDEKQAWSTLPIAVVIDDGNGYWSVYAHFSKVVVRKGQTVQAGQLIGYEGATGRASGCHLHYGLFSPFERSTFAVHPTVVRRMLVPDRQTARVDPLRVLPERPDPQARPTPAPTFAPPPAGMHEPA